MGEERRKSGCGTVALIVGVVVLIAIPVASLFSAFYFSRTEVGSRMDVVQMMGEQQGGEDGTVVFQQNAIPRFAPHQRGDELKREQFVALMIDDLATELARKEFQSSANGAFVSWLLRTEDLSERDGVPHGQFTLPYEIRFGHGSQSSSVALDCDFLPESKVGLLQIRRGDWVVVEGTLSFDGRKVSITDARIAGDETTPRAEAP